MNEGFLYYFQCSTINKSGDEVKLVKVGMTTDPDNRLYKYASNSESVKMVAPPCKFDRLITVNDIALCESLVLSKLDNKFDEAGNEWFLLGDGSVIETVNRLFDELEETKGLSPEQREELFQTCTENEREKKRLWREKNPDYDKQYYEEHRDERRERSKQWAKMNPDKARERQRQWREENHDRILEYKRQWRKENPDKMREQGKRDRARKRMKKVTAVVMPLVWACACRNG